MKFSELKVGDFFDGVIGYTPINDYFKALVKISDTKYLVIHGSFVMTVEKDFEVQHVNEHRHSYTIPGETK